jgi:hypothetical protein
MQHDGFIILTKSNKDNGGEESNAITSTTDPMNTTKTVVTPTPLWKEMDLESGK